MGEIRGFLDYSRVDPKKQAPAKRVRHYHEFLEGLSAREARRQGARCMDCGVAFCHQGCPLGNLIPEWNHLVSEQRWEEALYALLETNNFPEFTGRICPAPCESSCVLGINEDPVSIEALEMAIADMGFERGWIKPEPPDLRTGKRVAIIGSGPAGLAAAQQLNRMGHWVDVYERADRPGGLLMYGIPDFKLDKQKVLRRIQLLEEEGIKFHCGVNIGKDVSLEELREGNDALLLACGSTKARDLSLEGRKLSGIHLAESFLVQSTRRQFSDPIDQPVLTAKNKKVIVIGGGDTGADCVGTSNRQGALSVDQFEIMPMPPVLGKFPRASQRPDATPWPQWPYMLRTSSSHEEGCSRHWALTTKRFVGNEKGELCGLETQEVCWQTDDSGRRSMQVVEGSEKFWPCDLVLLAIGFEGAETESLFSGLNIDKRANGSIEASEVDYQTNVEGIFTAGDARRGQSLVVWAIKEGREAAKSIHSYLSK